MKYLWSVVAALLLTAVALLAYHQPIGLDSWFHYAVVAVVALAATVVLEPYLKRAWLWMAAVVVALLGLVLFPPWPVYAGVGVLAALLAGLVPRSSPAPAPRHRHH